MKKKIMAAVLALSVVFASVPAAFAASELKTVIDSYLTDLGLATTDTARTVEVQTDISLKKDGDSTYVNGPLQVSVGESQTTKFDFKADIDMSDVLTALGVYKSIANGLKDAESNPDIKSAIENDIANSYVTGQFVITIIYPTQVTIPEAVKTGTGMVGFSSASDYTQIFEETVERDATTNGSLVITIDVKDDVTLSVLEENLADLTFACDDVVVTQKGTYSITGTVTGSIDVKAPDNTTVIGTLNYNFVQKPNEEGTSYVDPSNSTGTPTPISGTINVYKSGGSLSSGGVQENVLTVVIADGIESKTFRYATGTTVKTSEIEIPTRPGYKLEGLYADAEFTQPLEESFVLADNMTVYAKWGEETVESPFDSDEHFAYIIGYPTEDGSSIVKPEANITREEITTIYYRLLKDEIRYNLFGTTNDFSDVADDRWSNKAISAMANGGYINGYEDGTFGPGRSATRAEFVTIAARFYNVDADSIVMKSNLTDIDGHWAAAYIDYAVTQGWINGYEDGSFRPDQYITRAEVMKIVNSMLGRHVDEEGIAEGAIRWDDNSADEWYYYDVIEATNAHNYERAENETYEQWTEITENKVWADKPSYEDAE